MYIRRLRLRRYTPDTALRSAAACISFSSLNEKNIFRPRFLPQSRPSGRFSAASAAGKTQKARLPSSLLLFARWLHSVKVYRIRMPFPSPVVMTVSPEDFCRCPAPDTVRSPSPSAPGFPSQSPEIPFLACASPPQGLIVSIRTSYSFIKPLLSDSLPLVYHKRPRADASFAQSRALFLRLGLVQVQKK